MSSDICLAEIGARIKKKRVEKNMDQTELAERAGFNNAAISRLECGVGDPTILTLKKITDALEIQLVDLLRDSKSEGFLSLNFISAIKVPLVKLLF